MEWEADIFVEKLLMHQQNQSRITRLAWMSNKAAKKDAVRRCFRGRESIAECDTVSVGIWGVLVVIDNDRNMNR